MVAPLPDEFPPPVKATIGWLRDTFAQYYRDNPPAAPDRATRREYGFILWPNRPGPPPFVRHKAFDARGLHDFLARGPHSAYYSTAYYRRPGEARMADKHWLGAELIFDLDADHLEEVEAATARGESVDLAHQLALVKDKFRALLDEFLLGDLGLDPRHVWCTFSGGRGYHAHVTDPRVLGLDAKARRQIVDYVTGKVPAKKGSEEPDVSVFFQKRAVVTEGRGRFAKTQAAYDLAPATAPGWPGRLTRGLVSALDTHILQEDRATAKRWLTSMKGIGPKGADEFLARFDADALQRIRQGHLSHQGDVLVKVAAHVIAQTALPLARGETDEPVTADVKRLIRLPGSLHGKSGLRVVTLDIEALADFDPFRDAVALPTDDAVSVTPRFSQTIDLGGQAITLEEGDQTEIPTAHAVWMAARQGGSVHPRTP